MTNLITLVLFNNFNFLLYKYIYKTFALRLNKFSLFLRKTKHFLLISSSYFEHMFFKNY